MSDSASALMMRSKGSPIRGTSSVVLRVTLAPFPDHDGGSSGAAEGIIVIVRGVRDRNHLLPPPDRHCEARMVDRSDDDNA